MCQDGRAGFLAEERVHDHLQTHVTVFSQARQHERRADIWCIVCVSHGGLASKHAHCAFVGPAADAVCDNLSMLKTQCWFSHHHRAGHSNAPKDLKVELLGFSGRPCSIRSPPVPHGTGV